MDAVESELQSVVEYAPVVYESLLVGRDASEVLETLLNRRTVSGLSAATDISLPEVNAVDERNF